VYYLQSVFPTGKMSANITDNDTKPSLGSVPHRGESQKKYTLVHAASNTFVAHVIHIVVSLLLLLRTPRCRAATPLAAQALSHHAVDVRPWQGRVHLAMTAHSPHRWAGVMTSG
jgi:hypothetical protein